MIPNGAILAFATALFCGAAPAAASVLEVRYQVDTEIYAVGSPYVHGGAPHGSGILTVWYQAPSNLPPGTNGANVQPIPGPVSLLSGSLEVETHVVFGGMLPGAREFTLMLEFERAQGTLNSMGSLLLPDIRGAMNGHFGCSGIGCFLGTGSVDALILIPAFQDQWTAPGHFVGGQLRPIALETRAFSGTNQAPGTAPFPFGIHIMDAQEIDRRLVSEVPALPPLAGGLAAVAIALAGVLARRRRLQH